MLTYLEMRISQLDWFSTAMTRCPLLQRLESDGFCFQGIESETLPQWNCPQLRIMIARIRYLHDRSYQNPVHSTDMGNLILHRVLASFM